MVAVLALVLLGSGCGEDEPLPPEQGGGRPGGPAEASQDDGCDWPMAGQNLLRTHASTCAADGVVGAESLDRLEQVWFAETRAEVTGAPAVTDDALYLGDWSGRVYALDRATGEEIWTRDLPPHPPVYAGQVPASPAVADRDGEEVVVVASGRTAWVLRAEDGEPVWDRVLGDPDDDEDPIQIEGSPAVADGLVVLPTDVHNRSGHSSGLVALSLDDGAEEWRFDPEGDTGPNGCGSIWGTPSVDVEAGLVVVGTGSCFSEDSWTEDTEAIVGVDLATGERRWSFQPREYNAQDWDFAGAPNLFTIGDRPVAGLGNKDGSYYVVDREDGELVWQAEAVEPSGTGDGFAFGGFIGATVVAPDDDGRLVVAGGTAVGDCPCQHGLDAATGEVLWQSDESGGTYGASGAAGGVVFTAGIDQTIRAFDLATGEVRWERPLNGISASGPAIAGELLAIGVGFREPGSGETVSGGVHAFRVLADGETAPTSTTTTVPEGPAVTALAPSEQPCVGAPCEVDFTLKDPPEGRSPTMTLEVTPDPLRIRVETTDLGPPEAWLGGDGVATVYAVFITPRDDRPELGSVICVLDDSGSCEGDTIDIAADSYTRISLLAMVDAATPPTLQEGYERLVTTWSFDPPLVPTE